MLNPALKRFQYLPHLPAGESAGKHGCAAPTGVEPRHSPEVDKGRSISWLNARFCPCRKGIPNRGLVLIASLTLRFELDSPLLFKSTVDDIRNGDTWARRR